MASCWRQTLSGGDLENESVFLRKDVYNCLDSSADVGETTDKHSESSQEVIYREFGRRERDAFPVVGPPQKLRESVFREFT